jgi:hypothetical protein
VDKDKEASKRVKDRESGVARGIDFQFVANVINFDFPKVSPPFFIITVPSVRVTSSRFRIGMVSKIGVQVISDSLLSPEAPRPLKMRSYSQD